MARVAFLGTPALAVPFLQALVERHEVVGVITRPDAPRGRSKRPAASPVSVAATGLKVEKPARGSEVEAALRSFGDLDVAVVVAYGALIRPDALEVPRLGCVNVHFSLLPRWRGAAPVQRAILAGDDRTGVTVMKLDAGLDTGPYLGVTAVGLSPSLTAGDVFERLVASGVSLLSRVLDPYMAGRVIPVRQPEGGTQAPKITADEARLDVLGDPEVFAAKAMAFSPTPGAWIKHEHARFRVLRARVGDRSLAPGQLAFDGRTLLCGVGTASVELVEVQPAGGRAMSGADWARGRRGSLGRLA